MLQRRERTRLALLFYGAMTLAAWIWGALAGRPQLLWDAQRSSWSGAAWGLLAGSLFGLAVAGLSRPLLRFRWARYLQHWFISTLGPVGWRDAAILAACSAIGEEAFFRGAMQPSWGLTVTTLLFAAVHFPPQLRLLPWTISAGLLGWVFGLSAQWSGNLAAPMAAHFVINLLNLHHMSATFQPPPSPPPTIANGAQDLHSEGSRNETES